MLCIVQDIFQYEANIPENSTISKSLFFRLLTSKYLDPFYFQKQNKGLVMGSVG